MTNSVHLLTFVALLLVKAPSLQANFVRFRDNGPSSNRVDIVFLGDGYTSAQLGVYQSHIGALMSHLFDDGQDPFPRYRNYFNAHRIEVISQQSGADDPTAGLFVNTALDASYRYDGVTQQLLYIDDQKAAAALSASLGGALTPDIRFVTVNASQYGGGGGASSVYAGGNSSATEIALHELGHSFAGLADEYGGFDILYSGNEPDEVNVTKDPTGAKWAHWIGYHQPEIGTIGVYEGARYYDRGLYRPSQNSKMRALGSAFDAVSREALILGIYRIVDPLDAWLDNASPLADPANLWVNSIDPDIIQHQWLVDGSLVAGAGRKEFNPLAFGFGPGSYTVTAHSFDPTDWVRGNLDLLQQDISWTVTYTVPEPSYLILITGTLSWFFLRRKSYAEQRD